jgi:hypothetical protein
MSLASCLLILRRWSFVIPVLPVMLSAQPVKIKSSTEKPPPSAAGLVLPLKAESKPGTGSSVFEIKNLGADLGAAIMGYSGTGQKAIGVLGFSPDGEGIGGLGGYAGVRGITQKAGGRGVIGEYQRAGPAAGRGFSDAFGDPDAGVTKGFLGTETAGVHGESQIEGGKGVAGKANTGANAVGVYGESTVGMAGFFRGRVTITDHLLVNKIFAQTISAEKGIIGGAAGKFFKIDHPLDPANQYLYHASVESPELKNLYDGVVTLDDTGAASVVLPEWFEALNREFRYQLTCIGGYAPVYIAKEVERGRFEIAGGRRGMKVSWQVTGVRQDVYAKKHPMKVEENKTPAERGRYLYPVEHGFPEKLGINYQRDLVGRIDDRKPASAVRSNPRPK